MAGRKNKYQTHVEPYLKEIEHWCRDGATEEEIRVRLGVGSSSFARYKNEYWELRETLKRGKQEADYEVEDALFKRATGYQYEEVTYEMGHETKRVVKHYAPDPTSAIFWLKNRQPEKWKDKQDIEHSGGLNNQVDLSGLTVEELRKLADSND
ncbi:hypothetical protein [Salibacterium qingdaonense]|uniref:Uncharacterized protein n=1 Tax=Salibacterium qingdaonense TaxID=266892 RepID=A0A1I4Q5Z3_9BACI|nr:hypothetical protein [Salibacterium qingdaonense]SFM35489.1 hypothetical protein SAMN04488054_13720 [Salibacterium qingdaonense]